VKLVVDNSNIEELPVGNLQDIGGMARRFADDLEAGEYGETYRVVVVLQRSDSSLAIMGWGENGSPYEFMGLFEAAKLRVFADDVIDD
jgi:hypothetical protein